MRSVGRRVHSAAGALAASDGRRRKRAHDGIARLAQRGVVDCGAFGGALVAVDAALVAVAEPSKKEPQQSGEAPTAGEPHRHSSISSVRHSAETRRSAVLYTAS